VRPVRRLVLPLAVLALPAFAARADEVVLKNGRTLEGEVVVAGEVVVFTRPGLRMEIRKDEVGEIRRSPSKREQYAAKAAAQAKLEESEEYLRDCRPAAADAHHRLGLWCAAAGLREEARAEQEKAIVFDGDHAGARRALGQVRDAAGRWRPEDEVMREKGLVLVDGRWTAPGEAAGAGAAAGAARERREARDRDRRMRRSLNAALRQVADPDAQVRERGEKALVEAAREMGDLGLEARAAEVRNYYDLAYREIARAQALIQVRAQVVTLKRPIPTFRTSLGAFSSPVTLQLPEISVISINTTALVPLQVDED
jgi:hypothetical protein